MSKVVLITGTSSGIGKATAKRLLSEGCKVYGASRNIDKMKDLESAGMVAIKMDITNDQEVQNVVNLVFEKEGKIDVLFNNSGFGMFGPIEEIPLEKARYQYEVNVFGLARITQLVLPIMRKQGYGTIINNSSIGGKIYVPFGGWYFSTKHAVECLSDCLRNEVRPFGVKVVIVEPGLIETEFSNNALGELPQESKEGVYKKMVNNLEKAMTEERYKGSNPDVIAKVISKIVSSKNPKRRYAAGSLAKPMLFTRRWLGDGFFDFLIGLMVR